MVRYPSRDGFGRGLNSVVDPGEEKGGGSSGAGAARRSACSGLFFPSASSIWTWLAHNGSVAEEPSTWPGEEKLRRRRRVHRETRAAVE